MRIILVKNIKENNRCLEHLLTRQNLRQHLRFLYVTLFFFAIEIEHG